MYDEQKSRLHEPDADDTPQDDWGDSDGPFIWGDFDGPPEMDRFVLVERPDPPSAFDWVASAAVVAVAAISAAALFGFATRVFRLAAGF